MLVAAAMGCSRYDRNECELRGLGGGEYLVRNFATGKAERIRCPALPHERTRAANQEQKQEFRKRWQRTQEAVGQTATAEWPTRQMEMAATQTATIFMVRTRETEARTRETQRKAEIAATQTMTTSVVRTRIAATRSYCEQLEKSIVALRYNNDRPAIDLIRQMYADEIKFCGIE